jgi:flavin-dependent dehydrogenase
LIGGRPLKDDASSPYDVAVIGGGPSGLSAAAVTAGAGLRTIVLETKKEIGTPVQCGEALSDRGLDYSGIGEGEWIIHRISRYRIFSPSGHHIGSRTNGFCIDRRLFDSELGNVASSEGARISLSCNAVSASRGNDLWTIGSTNGQIKTRAVILATGPMSHLNPAFGLSRNLEVMRGVGAKIKRKGDSTCLDFYVKGDLDGGYGWYFPRIDEVNIGIAARDGLKDQFAMLMDRLGIDRNEIISWHGGVVPDGGPISKFIGDSVIAVGDCGGFSHPVSKGGIYCAMFTGREGAKAVVEVLSGDGSALKKADKLLRGHPAYSLKNVKRREFLAGMDDKVLDELAALVDGRDIQSLDRKKIALEAVKRPHLYPLIRKGLTMVQKGKDWLDYTF